GAGGREEAEIGPQVERPQGGGRERERGGPVAELLAAGQVLEELLRALDVGAERLPPDLVGEAVGVAVRRDLVAGGGDHAGERRMPLGVPGEHEEGRLDPRLREHAEDALGVADDPALVPAPGGELDDLLEVGDLEPVLHVDRESVNHVVPRIDGMPCSWGRATVSHRLKSRPATSWTQASSAASVPTPR